MVLCRKGNGPLIELMLTYLHDALRCDKATIIYRQISNINRTLVGNKISITQM